MTHPMIDETLSKAKSSNSSISLTQMYESDDLRILRNALLAEHQLMLDKNGLVVHRDTPSKPYQPPLKQKDETSRLVTYIATPLCIDELNGLLDMIFKALLQRKRAQILFPYRMEHSAHWVTGQILIEDLNITLVIYDSAMLYQKEDIEDKLKEILQLDLQSFTKLLQQCHTIPLSEHPQILEIIFGKNGINKIKFQTRGRGQIYNIQKHGLYCGGYSIRLIHSLVQYPAIDLREAAVWRCDQQSELQLRQEDLALVEKHCNHLEKKIFNSRSRGDEYLATKNQKNQKDKDEAQKPSLSGVSKAFSTADTLSQSSGYGSGCSRETQQMAFKQQTKARQRSERALGFIGKSHLAEDIELKEVQGLRRKAIERLPDLPDLGDHICWYYSNNGALEGLLDLAKGRESSKQFTKNDLAYVIQCGRLASIPSSILSVLNDQQKTVKLAIKILSYLSQNRCKLSPDAIHLLIEKLEDKNNKIKQSATIALIYAINNEQSLSGSKSIEISIAEKIHNNLNSLFLAKEQLLHLPEILAGFAALTKHGIKLSEQELDILKKSLDYVGTELYTPLFPKTKMHLESYPDCRMSRLRFTLPELRFIKNIAKTGNLLHNRELKYSIRNWKDNTKTKYKGKAIQIIRHSIVNRQRRYSEPELVKEALTQALDYPDRKIQNNAIMALGFLVHSEGGERNNYFILRNHLNKTLTTSRQYALTALNYHIQPLQKESLQRTAEWLTILKPLQEDETLSISVTAKFISTSISGDIRILEKLIVDPNYSTEISLLFAIAAKEKKILSESLLKNLSIILRNSDRLYPFEAMFNALVILRHVAENGQAIPSGTLSVLLNFASLSFDPKVFKVSLGIFGSYAKHHINELLNEKLIAFLLNAIDRGTNLKETCYFIKNVIRNLDKICFEEEFKIALAKSCAMLEARFFNLECRKAILLLLLHAAKKGFTFSRTMLVQLANGLVRQDNDSLLGIFLETLKFLLEQTQDISIPAILFKNLIKLMQHESETVKNDASYLIIQTLSKVKTDFPTSLFDNLAVLLKNPLQCYHASSILRKIAERNVALPINILEILSECLANNENTETAVNAACILKICAGKMLLTKKIHLNFFAAIKEDRAEEILDYAILALKTIFEQNLQQEDLPKVTIINLVSLMRQNINTEQSLNIAALLRNSSLCVKPNRFDLRILYELKDLMPESNDKLCAAIVAILRLQMKKRHEGQINQRPRQEIQQILNKIESLSEEGEKLFQILLFYSEAIPQGYSLSSKTLEKISRNLAEGKNKEIRDIAYLILKTHPSKNVSKKAQAICELETIGRLLNESKTTAEEKIRQMKKILVLVKEGHLLSQNTLLVFAKLAEERPCLCINELIEVLYSSVQQGTRLPLILIEKLVLILKDKSLEKPRLNILEVMLFVLNQGNCMPDIVLKISEELIADSSTQENELLYQKACNFFEIILQKTGKIEKLSFLQLIKALKRRNTTVQIASARLLYQAVKTNHEYATHFDDIAENLNAVTHRDAAHYLLLAIKELLLNTPIQSSKRSIDIFLELLTKKNSFGFEESLIEILDLISKTTKLPIDVVNLLELRKTEQTLSTKLKLQEMLAPLFFLTQQAKLISTQGFMALVELLKTEDSKTKALLLTTVIKIQKVVPLPAFLLEQIALSLNEEQYFNTIYDILMGALNLTSQTNGNFSVTIINKILDIQISHPNSRIRELLLTLLDKIEKTQTLPGAVKTTVAFERDIYRIKKEKNTSPEILQKLLDRAKDLPKISYNTINFFLALLRNKDHSLHSYILTLLLQSKEVIPIDLYEEILIVLTTLHTEKTTEEKPILSLCLFFLSCPTFQCQKWSALVTFFKRELMNSFCLTERTDLLNQLLEKMPENSIGPLFDTLLEKLIKTPHEKHQHELLSMLSKAVLKPYTLSDAGIALILNYAFPFLKNSSIATQKYSESVRQKFFKIIAFLFRRNPDKLAIINCQFLDIKKSINEYYLIDDTVINQISKMKLFDKLNLLLTLKSNHSSDRIIVNQHAKNLEECPRAILCAVLLSKTKKIYRGMDFEATQKRFLECFSEFEKSKGYHLQNKLERDNILFILSERQEKEQLSLQDIIATLAIMNDCKSSILDFLAKTPNIKILCIENLLKKFIHKFLLDENSISRLSLMLHDTGWDIESCTLLLSKIAECNNPTLLEKFILFCTKYKVKSGILQFFLTDTYSRKAASSMEQLNSMIQRELLSKILHDISDFTNRSKYIKEFTDNLFKIDDLFLNRLMEFLAKTLDFDHIFTFINKLKDNVVNGKLVNLDAVVSFFDTIYFYDLPSSLLRDLEEIILD